MKKKSKRIMYWETVSLNNNTKFNFINCHIYFIFDTSICAFKYIMESDKSDTGCSLNIVFFSKNPRKFATSPSPSLGCYWLYKEGVTVHSHCVESLQRCRREGGIAVKCEEHNFSWTACSSFLTIYLLL